MPLSTEQRSSELLTGVDLGGTKIEAAVLSRNGAILSRERVATPVGDYDATIKAISSLIEIVEAQAGGGSADIGVGTPGSISPKTGLIRNANSTVLNGRPFNRDLETALARPVRLANDANCFSLAEAVSGAGQDARVVFGVIIGTGVGAGVVADCQVVTGRNAIGGEWGHNPLPSPSDAERPGPQCYCGRRGCIETWCSGPGLAADHRSKTGSDLLPERIVLAAEQGDGAARATLSRHTDRLGRALAGVVNVLDPDIIILGGGLSNLSHLYNDLHEAIRPHVFSDCFETPIVQNRLGDSAGVIGAAWLAGRGTDDRD